MVCCVANGTPTAAEALFFSGYDSTVVCVLSHTHAYLPTDASSGTGVGGVWVWVWVGGAQDALQSSQRNIQMR